MLNSDDDKLKTAKGYYRNALEEFELVSFCFETKRFKLLIPRCYYSIFNLCRIIMVLELEDTRSHKVRISNFNKTVIHERKQFDSKYGSFLTTLEKYRGLCDYEANFNIDKDLAIELYNETLEFSEVLKDYIKQYGIEGK